MDKPVKPKPKKPYKKPKFVVYGTVQELRRKAGLNEKGDCAR